MMKDTSLRVLAKSKSKPQIDRSSVDVLDDIRNQANGLRGRVSTIVTEAEKQIDNHQHKVAWCKTDVIKHYDDLAEYVAKLGTVVDELRD